MTVTAVLSKFGQLGAAASHAVQRENEAALRSALRARGLDLKLPPGKSIPGMIQYAVAAAHARRDALHKLGDAASPYQQNAKLREVADAFLGAVGFLDRACYREGQISEGLLELDELRASDQTFLLGVMWSKLPLHTTLRDRARVRAGVDKKSPIVGESLEPGTPIVIAGYGVSPFLEGESTERARLTSPVKGWISCSKVEDGELLKQLARRSRQAALPRVPVAERPTPVQKSTRWQHEGTSLFEPAQADAAGRAHEAARACGGGRRLGETARKDAEGRDERRADDGVDEDDAHR